MRHHIVELGYVEAETCGSYFNGWLIDGPKAFDPQAGRWVYLKYYTVPAPIPGVAELER
jgi:hypothetical protein